MGGSIADWNQLYSEIYKHLKPGGLLEMQEFEAWVRSDDDVELKNAANVLSMLQEVDKASVVFGKQVNIAAKVKQSMIDAGFEEVTEVIHKV
jgi:predicted methyltransferase